jgi:hypothetical protein
MRMLAPAYVATSVVIALCGSASFAAGVARSGTAMTSSPAAITSPANASGTSSSAAATNPAAGGTTTSAGSTTTGNSTTGAPGVDSTGAIATSVNGSMHPVIVDGGVFGVNPSVGERIDNGSVNANVATYAGAQVGQLAGAAVDVQDTRNSQSFDRAVNTVRKDRQRIGRNGQLLQSIAPRTGADRSNEMPNDPPSPALTGSSSALTGR